MTRDAERSPFSLYQVVIIWIWNKILTLNERIFKFFSFNVPKTFRIRMLV